MHRGADAVAEQSADSWHGLAQPCLQRRLAEQPEKHASAGNRTRVTSMATMYSTTRPLMLMFSVICGFAYSAFTLSSAQPGPSPCTHLLSKPCLQNLQGLAGARGCSKLLQGLAGCQGVAAGCCKVWLGAEGCRRLLQSLARCQGLQQAVARSH